MLATIHIGWLLHFLHSQLHDLLPALTFYLYSKSFHPFKARSKNKTAYFFCTIGAPAPKLYLYKLCMWHMVACLQLCHYFQCFILCFVITFHAGLFITFICCLSSSKHKRAYTPVFSIIASS